jgi:hypothetical protein
MTDSLKLVYKHRDKWECFTNILLTYIVNLLDKCNKVLQNARYVHEDYSIESLSF